MVHLPDPGLDPGATGRLNEYQGHVDEAGSYAARVVRAKESFSQRNKSSNPTFRKVRESLTRMCSGAQRCVYCEDSVGDEVEHIEPKDLYPCLVFVWTNYVYACGRCNGGKSNKFAVIQEDRLVDVTRPQGASVVPPAPGTPARTPAFLNPRVENPLDFLDLDLDGTFLGLARDDLPDIDRERTEFTIETLKLNRDVLLQARATAFASYRARLHEYVSRREVTGAEELGGLVDNLKTMPHVTVWAEMKRQRLFLPDLEELFSRAPEALHWLRPALSMPAAKRMFRLAGRHSFGVSPQAARK